MSEQKNKVINDFIKVVYPENTELCMCTNNEESTLRHATELINELEEKYKKAIDTLKKIKKEIDDFDDKSDSYYGCNCKDELEDLMYGEWNAIMLDKKLKELDELGE